LDLSFQCRECQPNDDAGAIRETVEGRSRSACRTISIMKKTEIITAIIAVYGAVLSTIAIVRQFVSDRVKVKLTVRKNMEMVGDPRYDGMTLTILTVTNIGRRPVTITTFEAIRLHPNQNFVAIDSRPQLPSEITEGKFITSIWDQKDIDFSLIDYWAAWDSHGRVYKLQEASWFKHSKSVFRLKRSFRKKKAASE
jgi:hypothetical protein